MKKNTKKIVAMLLVAVVAVGSYFVAGTYAKYTSSASGESTVRVAKWDFEVGTGANKANITTSNTFTFNLFDTINESDTTTAETDVVAANGTDKLVAPGTGGSFDIVLKNDSEVSAKYGIVYTLTNTANIPVEFSTDGGTTWTPTLTNIIADDTNTKLTANGGTITKTVKWRWAHETGESPYTAGDTADTDLGKVGTATLTVKADVTATQID